MEGLRGFAVLLVFFVHFHSIFEAYFPPESSLNSFLALMRWIGHSGVDLFFVLSGYLIYSLLIRKDVSYLRFMWRRVCRLYPTFLAVFVMYLAASAIVPSRSKLPHDPLDCLVYLVANLLLLPGIVRIEPLITVSWSLSYEVFFYTTLPLIVRALRLRKWSGRARSILFAVLTVAHFVLVRFGVLGHQRLAMFLGGILLFELVQSLHVELRLPVWGEVLIAALYGICLVWIGAARMQEWSLLSSRTTIGLVTGAALYVATTVFAGYTIFYAGFLQKAFSWTPLRWLGNMSYSYYLLHGLVLQGEWLILSKFRQAPFGSVVSVLILLQISLAATIVLSALLFWTVEKPFSLREPKAPRPEVADNGLVPQGEVAGEVGVSGLVSSGELEKAR